MVHKVIVLSMNLYKVESYVIQWNWVYQLVYSRFNLSIITNIYNENKNLAIILNYIHSNKLKWYCSIKKKHRKNDDRYQIIISGARTLSMCSMSSRHLVRVCSLLSSLWLRIVQTLCSSAHFGSTTSAGHWCLPDSNCCPALITSSALSTSP